MPHLTQGTELVGEYESSGLKEPIYLLRRADGQVIQLSRLLYLVLAEVDGQKDFELIALKVSREFGRTISADNVRFLVEKKLQPLGVLTTNDGSSPKLERAKPMLALDYRVPIISEGMVRALAVFFRPLFLLPVVVAMLAGLVALDYWLFFVHGIGKSFQEMLYQPELFLMVVGLSVLSAAFHELGHATACHYGGAKPGRIGVGLYLIWPVFYNDVTDAYRLGRTGRLRTDLGGLYFNAIFSLILAAAYLLTGFEPLLLVIFAEQGQMLYQLLPFIRLDGYYVLSDLTGVPDLFSRIKPILKSFIRGGGTERRVADLKPWVRVVVTIWATATIPALLGLFTVLLMNAPRVYASAWDSFWVHYDKILNAFGAGRTLGGIAGMIEIVLLIVPVIGMTLAFALMGRRLMMAVWRWSKGRFSRRSLAGGAFHIRR